MSFVSTVEGRVGVDGVDRWRKTVPHIGTAEKPSLPNWVRVLCIAAALVVVEWSCWWVYSYNPGACTGPSDRKWNAFMQDHLLWQYNERGQPSTVDSDDEELGASELQYLPVNRVFSSDCTNVFRQLKMCTCAGYYSLHHARANWASHWPRVTDISDSPTMGSRPRRGRWAPAYGLC